MPTPCSIPGCRTNRSKCDPAGSVFCFPKEPLRLTQWEWAIQQLYDPTYAFRQGNKICRRHFEEKFIEKEHRAVRDDGSILTIPRKSVALAGTAVPTLFDFLPDPHPSATGAKTSPTPGTMRRSKTKRRLRTIPTLEALKSEFPVRVQKEDLHGWQLVSNGALSALSLYKVEINEDFEPELKYSVTLKEDLSVKVVHPEVSLKNLYRVVGQHQTCDDWTVLFRLLRLLDGEVPPGRKRCRMKVIEKEDVVVLEISHPGSNPSAVAQVSGGEDGSDIDDDFLLDDPLSVSSVDIVKSEIGEELFP